MKITWERLEALGFVSKYGSAYTLGAVQVYPVGLEDATVTEVYVHAEYDHDRKALGIRSEEDLMTLVRLVNGDGSNLG